jgi:MFS family permease
MSFGRFSYTLILPDMMKTLGLTATKMGVLGMAIVSGYLANSLLSGTLASVIGPEKTININIFLLSVSLIALGFFSRFFILIAAAFFTGAAAAGCYIPLVSLLNYHFDQKGKAFGLVLGGTGVGIMLCGWVIPPLLDMSEALGYRLSWYVLALINGGVMIPSLLVLRSEKPGGGSEEPPRLKRGIVPLLRTNPPLIITVVIYFLLGFSYIIYATYFGAYCMDELGFSSASTGHMWSLFGVNLIYSGILAGTLLDRFNKLNVSTVFNTLLALSIALIIPFKRAFLFYISAFLFGFSFMGFLVAIASLISDEVHRQEMGRVFGAATLVHGAGQVMSTLLARYLKDVTRTYRAPFVISLVVLIICVVLFLFLKLMGKKSEGSSVSLR